MKVGRIHAFYARASASQPGVMLLVLEREVILEEKDMVPLGADIVKATANINRLLDDNKRLSTANANLVGELDAVQKQLAEAMSEPKGIQTDPETDDALNVFHDLVATLPDPVAPVLGTAAAVSAPVASNPTTVTHTVVLQ